MFEWHLNHKGDDFDMPPMPVSADMVEVKYSDFTSPPDPDQSASQSANQLKFWFKGSVLCPIQSQVDSQEALVSGAKVEIGPAVLQPIT